MFHFIRQESLHAADELVLVLEFLFIIKIQNQIMNNRSRFYNLILNCPLNVPVKDCVFTPYRKMSISELMNMKDSEIFKILKNHDDCMKKREMEIKNTATVTDTVKY